MSAEAGPSRPPKTKKVDKSSRRSHHDRHGVPDPSVRADHTDQVSGGPQAAPGSSADSTQDSERLDSPFRTVRSTIRLSIPPIFAMDLRRGAEELLDSLVMRHSPALRAVLLSYSNVHFEDPTGADIVNDCPFAVCNVAFDAVVWKPEVGMRLAGTHSISTASHISLILYKTFNITIPLPHIPLDAYEFDESASEAILRKGGEDVDADADMELTEEEEREREEMSEGRWRRKLQGGREGGKGDLLGKDGEDVIFTVVGLHVANQMLSLTGSLLSNPSEPRHAPTSADATAFAPAPGTQLARERATIPSAVLEHGVASAVGHEAGEGLVSGPSTNSNKKAGKATNVKTKAIRDTDIAAAKSAVRGPSTPVELVNALAEEAEDPFKIMDEKKTEEARQKAKEEKAARKAERAKRRAAKEAASGAAAAAQPTEDNEGDEKTDETVMQPAQAKKQKKRAAEESAGKEGQQKKRKKD